jgi:putative transposase
MGAHFHVLLRLREPTLSAGMQLLNGLYARRFNERYGGSGHVFRRRFHHQPVERETHLFETLRYLTLNPVRAGLCADPAE